MHGPKKKLQKRSGLFVVLALVISSFSAIAAPSALAATPSSPSSLVMCKSLKTAYQYVSSTGTCNNRIYETIKWYSIGTSPAGTPGSKLISLNTCQSMRYSGPIVLKAKCNIKTETTLPWERPLGPPAAPAIKAVQSGKLGTAEIEYIAPENNGGARVFSYKALSNPGGFTSTVQRESSGKITVVGLQPGTKYTFTVLAANSVGTSLASPYKPQMCRMQGAS